ncbi:hypothetical protein GMO_24490 [Gluconobacter morbifer G707]|uniref:Uncharacterized protein n=1 Tax=Gluconobacter morbifer G707 TaxID=1088869 RepID=G6XL26_9PROT|nr:hypothetical protein GMO_24490 [Gluconobacter morbifer G707]
MEALKLLAQETLKSGSTPAKVIVWPPKEQLLTLLMNG